MKLTLIIINLFSSHIEVSHLARYNTDLLTIRALFHMLFHCPLILSIHIPQPYYLILHLLHLSLHLFILL